MSETRIRSLPPLFALVLLAASLAFPLVAAAPPPVEDALFDKLRAGIATVESRLDGVLGVAVKDLATGRVIEIRGDVVFPQASTIKLALVGLVGLKHRPYAAAIMTTALENERDGESAIRGISRLVYETFDRLDRMSPEGRLLGR